MDRPGAAVVKGATTTGDAPKSGEGVSTSLANRHPTTVRPRPRSWWLGLSLISAAGLALRLVDTLVAQASYREFSDSLYYYEQGRYLAQGKGFIDPVGYLFSGRAAPSAAHPPLYGMFLGVVSWLGATTRDGSRVASCVLGTATVVLVALVARRIANPRAGLIAAAIAAFYPGLWLHDAVLMSETMAAAMVALTLLAVYRFRDRPTLVAAALLGGVLGLATLARAETILLFPLVAIPFALSPRVGQPRQRVKLLGTTTLALIVVLGPWVGSNLVRFQHPELLTTTTGSALEYGSCDTTFYGPKTGWFTFCSSESPPPGDESVGDAFRRHQALTYLRAHATRLPVVLAARIGRVWGIYRPIQTVELDRHGGLTDSWLQLIGYYLALPFAVGGLVVLRRRHVPILPLVALIIVVTVTVALASGIPRYRVSADVGIVIAAGAGIDALLRWWSWTQMGRRAPAHVTPDR